MALVASCDNTGLNPMSFTDQQGSVVLERLRYQRETGRFCDVAIIVKERQFSAHRNILASCSPYFDSIFKSAKITKEQVTVNCPSPSVFETFLNYMYSGSVVIDRSTVTELLRLANNFLITKLKNYCTEYLDRYLDAANCLSIRTLATRYNIPSLLKASSDYFDVNINRCLLESTDVVGYTYHQLVALITDPKYCDVITADTHLKLIVRWIGEELACREISFRKLLESCQMREVADETLDFLLDYSPLLAKSPSSRFLLLHVMYENGQMREKYESQFANLRQQIGELPPMHDPSAYDDDDMSSDGMEDEEYDYPVDGQPTTAKILESENVDGAARIKMKINFSVGDMKRKFKRPRGMMKRRNRPMRDAQENEMIPMVDDDDIDGVYATCSLEGAHTYGPVDLVDPEEVEDGEDIPEEGGQYVCVYCQFPAATKEALERHRARTHNRNTYYLCQLCEYETNWSKEFYEHCQEHWTERPYRCEVCPFSASNSIQELLAHRLTHTEERFFKCGECAWKGRTRSQLFAHERMHSVLDDRPLHCEECGRGFHQHVALDMHTASHNESRSLICEDCGFATKAADHLALHRRQHTGDIFVCHIAGCDYSSTKKSQLAAHLRTHMAVRAHMCKVCGRGFIEKSHLVRHERIHLEDKPFKCDACDYASSRRDKLKEHILKHHNGQTSAKAQRRKYRRARQLAVAASMNQVQNALARAIPQDALFRPITVDESVQRWAQSNDFSAYSPSRQNEFASHVASTTAPNPGNSFSPPRAYSVTNPPLVAHAAMSPGSMSMINVHLRGGGGVNTNDGQMRMDTPGTLVTPTVRSPHNRSADPFGGITTPNEMHRPMSLPTYGQMTDGTIPPQQTGNNEHQWW